ncbi:MAG: hypothetical protein M1827_001323 [Pycnora praestabilis]|nr:MAG: hypothetical protein M1827_001323 [Pycnora praestabilis]
MATVQQRASDQPTTGRKMMQRMLELEKQSQKHRLRFTSFGSPTGSPTLEAPPSQTLLQDQDSHAPDSVTRNTVNRPSMDHRPVSVPTLSIKVPPLQPSSLSKEQEAETAFGISPRSSVCVSPSWSDYGGKKKKKEKKRLEKESKELERQLKKEQGKLAKEDAKAAHRLSKKPPLGITRKNGLPATMKRSSTAPAEVFEHTMKRATGAVITQNQPIRQAAPSMENLDKPVRLSESSKHSSSSSSSGGALRSSSSTDNKYSTSASGAMMRNTPTTYQTSSAISARAPQLPQLPYISDEWTRSGPLLSANVFDDDDYERDLMEQAQQVTQHSPRKIAGQYTTSFNAKPDLSDPSAHEFQSSSILHDANDTRVEQPSTKASEHVNAALMDTFEGMKRDGTKGGYQYPYFTHSARRQSSDATGGTDLLPSRSLPTRHQGTEHAFAKKPRRPSFNSYVLPISGENTNYVQKQRFHYQEYQLADYEEEMQIAQITETLQMQTQSLEQHQQEASVLDERSVRSSDIVDRSSRYAVKDGIISEGKGDHDKQYVLPAETSRGSASTPQQELSTMNINKPLPPITLKTGEKTTEKTVSPPTTPRPDSPTWSNAQESGCILPSEIQTRRILGIEDNASRTSPPRSRTGIGSSSPRSETRQRDADTEEHRVDQSSSNGTTPTASRPQSRSGASPLKSFIKEPKLLKPLSRHSTTYNINTVGDGKSVTTSLENSTTAAPGKGEFESKEDGSNSTVNSVEKEHTSRTQLMAKLSKRAQAPEIIVEGIDGDGISRKTSVKRPRSNPQLQTTAQLQDLSFLPELKHQSLVKPKKSPASSVASSSPSFGAVSVKSGSSSPPQFPNPTPPSTRPSSDDGLSLPVGASSTNYLGARPQSYHSGSLLRPGNAPRRRTLNPMGPQSGSAAAKELKPLAKLFVICCKCTRWHDLPSRVYEAMALPRKIFEDEVVGATEGKVDTVRRSSSQNLPMTSSTPTLSLAILDDYQSIAFPHLSTIHPERLQITTFKSTLPSYTHRSTTGDEKRQLVERLHPFIIICTMRERTPFPAELLRQLPNLKLLLTTGMRNAAIDMAAARELGITVTGTTGAGHTISDNPSLKDYPGADSTVQHTWALILALARNVARDDAVVKQRGGWQTSLSTGLTGKTLGVLGLGRLGMRVAKIAVVAWGMRVVCWSSSLTQEGADQRAREAGLGVGDGPGGKTFRVVSKEELFRQADVLSVNYVLSERSRGILGERELALMKKAALLVNTSRGPLVDEEALLGVLKEGRIKGAALDVFDVEPLPKDSEWRTTEWGVDGRADVILSPHMGYVEEEVMHAWYEETAVNVDRWMKGEKLLNYID